MVHRALDWDDFQEVVHFVDDPQSGAKGVIVVHSTARGPAAGGCRFGHYGSSSALMRDAMRLAREMTYKNALAGLPFGGGKAVLQYPEGRFDRKRLFREFGTAIAELEGRYIAAEEVGTHVADMQAVAERTSYVAGLASRAGRAGGDPAPWTALGVFRAMQGARRHLDRRDLRGARVAVQGVGRVGEALCRLLAEAGARLVIADIDRDRAAAVAARHVAEVVDADVILSVEADILAPCAMGHVLGRESIAALRVPLVCGAANNQLAFEEDGEALRARGIVYAPDYVVNAGGIINVAAEYMGESVEAVHRRIEGIADRLIAILVASQLEQRPTNRIADEMARAILGRPVAWTS